MRAFSDFTEEFVIGSTHRFPVTVTRPDANGIAQPEPVATYQEFFFTGKLFISDTDAAALIHITMTGGNITILNAATGQVQIEIPDSMTATLPNRYYRLWCDFRGRDANGKTWTILSGMLNLYPNVKNVTS